MYDNQNLYDRSDSSSYARPLDAVSNHIDLIWEIDFSAQTISGTCEHLVKLLRAGVSEVCFDTSKLVINGDVLVDGKVCLNLQFIV